MFRVIRRLNFCYGHRLMNYEGKCRHPHGHNGVAEVELSRPRLDRRGMVLDFDEIKKTLQVWVDENFDHRMLLRKDDPLLPIFQRMGEPVYVTAVNPTAETIAREIFGAARRLRLPVTRVAVWETPKSCAVYDPG